MSGEMDQAYFSSSWYRVSGLRLRLRKHARIHRTMFRGQLWYVLQDRTSGRFHRFTPEAYFIVSLLDGQRSIQDVWDVACEQLDDRVLTQDRVIQLLGRLHAADVLHGDVPPDISELADRGRKQQNRKLMMSFMNPLALRVGLLDPNEFLNATFPLVRPLFSWFGALLFICITGYAAVLAGVHWAELTENVTDRVLSAENILLLLVAYPAIKAFHELGHAYAVKRWGGDVHEIGVMLLVFIPVPYVDASDSLSFQSKWQRALVGSAGILVEVLLAAIALLVWLNAEEGIVRALAFNVMLIGGISTLLFNGNPLLKFDGYYVLSDLIEIPNLAARANSYVGYLIQRYAFGVRTATSPATAPGEEKWLFFYSIASFCYRILITASIIAFVAGRFFIIGTILAVWALILMLGVPLAKQLWFLLTSQQLRHDRGRAFAVVGATMGIMAMALFAVPLPHSTAAQGVVWVSGDGIVHAGWDGVVVEVLASPGSKVSPGAPLLRLDDRLIEARTDLLEIRVKELELRLARQDVRDPAEARIIREELRLAGADLDIARERRKSLVVRSEADGTFILPGATDLVGSFVRRGDVLGYVARFQNPPIRVVVPEADADLVISRTKAVTVLLTGERDQTLEAAIDRQVPTLTNALPNLALSTVGGGAFALDPSDVHRRQVLANLLHLDLRLTDERYIPRIGSRVHVRFFHGYDPLAYRMYRSARQVFLRIFKS